MVGQELTENTGEAPPEERDLIAGIQECLGPLLDAEAAQKKKRTDERTETIRDMKDKINTTFWEYLFEQLRKATANSETDKFEFEEEDLEHFNFGWIDDRTFPREDLRAMMNQEDEALPNILYLTQWLVQEDRRNMEVSADYAPQQVFD